MFQHLVVKIQLFIPTQQYVYWILLGPGRAGTREGDLSGLWYIKIHGWWAVFTKPGCSPETRLWGASGKALTALPMTPPAFNHDGGLGAMSAME